MVIDGDLLKIVFEVGAVFCAAGAFIWRSSGIINALDNRLGALQTAWVGVEAHINKIDGELKKITDILLKLASQEARIEAHDKRLENQAALITALTTSMQEMLINSSAGRQANRQATPRKK